MMRRLFLLLIVLPLAACSTFLADMAGEPPALYELAAPTEIKADGPILPYQVLLDVPLASAGIDTPRVALVDQNGAMAYYKGVSWTDRVPVMYQSLLVTAFDRSGKLPAVGRENVGLRADFLIKTDLAAFQMVYARDKSAPFATVTLTAKLIIMPRRIIVAGQSFTATVAAESDTVSASTKALQQASDEVVKKFVSWTLAELPRHKVYSQ